MPLCDYVSPATTALGRQADCWEDAVRQAGALLEKAATIAPAYTQAMVDMVLAHARPEGNVARNSIAVVTCPAGVNFGNRSNDPVYAVFAIAARTDEEHLVLFRALAKFISEEANVERLKGAATFEEIGF